MDTNKSWVDTSDVAAAADDSQSDDIPLTSGNGSGGGANGGEMIPAGRYPG